MAETYCPTKEVQIAPLALSARRGVARVVFAGVRRVQVVGLSLHVPAPVAGCRTWIHIAWERARATFALPVFLVGGRPRQGRSELLTVTQALSEVFGRPTTPADTLKALRSVAGFSDQEIARALGVTARSVKRWRTGATINLDSEEQLFDMARIVGALSELGLPDANVRAWFFHRNRFLKDERPIDVFAGRGYEAVRPAVTAIADAAYA